MSLNPVTRMSSALSFGGPQTMIFLNLPAIAALFSTALERVQAFTSEATSEPYGRQILKPEIHYVSGEPRDCQVVDKIRELPPSKVDDCGERSLSYSFGQKNGVVTYSSPNYEGSFRGPEGTIVTGMEDVNSFLRRFFDSSSAESGDINPKPPEVKIQKTEKHPDPVIEWLRPIHCAPYASNPHFATYFQDADPFVHARSMTEILDNSLDTSIMTMWDSSGQVTHFVGDDNVDAELEGELRKAIASHEQDLAGQVAMDGPVKQLGQIKRFFFASSKTEAEEKIEKMQMELKIRKFNRKKGRTAEKRVETVEIPREMIDKYADGRVIYRNDKALLGLKRCFHVERNEPADCSAYLKDDDRLQSWFFDEPIPGRFEEGYVGNLSYQKPQQESWVAQLFSRIFG